jgi:hypothetical protein
VANRRRAPASGVPSKPDACPLVRSELCLYDGVIDPEQGRGVTLKSSTKYRLTPLQQTNRFSLVTVRLQLLGCMPEHERAGRIRSPFQHQDRIQFVEDPLDVPEGRRGP